MRHRVAGRKFKRTHSARKALYRGLATQLFRYKRIKTTEAKAKEMRRFAEQIITRAKRAFVAEQGGAEVSVHARRIVARDINDPAVVHELFTEIVKKVAHRPGGYTRVVKTRQRIGDGARLAILELVDYNMERDENAARNRSKSTMSRSERVARSKAKAAKGDAAATDSAAPKAASGSKAKAKTSKAAAANETAADATVAGATAHAVVADETAADTNAAAVDDVTSDDDAAAASRDESIPRFDATDDVPPVDDERDTPS